VYKVLDPHNFFLLRSNHECRSMNRDFGFYAECVAHYDADVWEGFSSVLDCLPLAAIVDGKIFCVHGGISPDLDSLDRIRRVARPAAVPNAGLVCDLLWADPDPAAEGWEPSDRRTSYTFGLETAREFLDRFGFDLICRAHQAVMGGFEFPFSGDRGVVTVFSAPELLR
jgi:serine/threonine-protein phosphatase PP1 catalytic subunit